MGDVLIECSNGQIVVDKIKGTNIGLRTMDQGARFKTVEKTPRTSRTCDLKRVFVLNL